MAKQWQVGEVYPGLTRNGLPLWSQPAGIGTPVLPAPQQYSPEEYMGYQQNIMSYPALYCFGCGHFLNCAEVFEVFDPASGEQAALICCNQCGYIQQIIVPYANYQDYMDTPIVTA